MNKVDTTYITVGKIGTTYGVRGWLKIQTYTELSARILDYTPWYIQQNENEWRVIQVEEGRVHGKSIVAKFVDVNTPEAARLYIGKDIAIVRSQLPQLNINEYYWSDLVGLNVINKDGSLLGKVIYIMATGSNDVLVIKNDKNKEHALPYLNEVIRDIDLEKQEIHVDWEIL